MENRFFVELTEASSFFISTDIPFNALVTNIFFRAGTGAHSQQEKEDTFAVVMQLADGTFHTVATFTGDSPTQSLCIQLVLTSNSGVKQISLRRTYSDPSKKLKKENASKDGDKAAYVVLSGMQVTTLTDDQVVMLSAS